MTHRKLPDAIFAQLKNGHNGTRRPDRTRGYAFQYHNSFTYYMSLLRAGEVDETLRSEWKARMRDFVDLARGNREWEPSRLQEV